MQGLGSLAVLIAKKVQIPGSGRAELKCMQFVKEYFGTLDELLYICQN